VDNLKGNRKIMKLRRYKRWITQSFYTQQKKVDIGEKFLHCQVVSLKVRPLRKLFQTSKKQLNLT